MSHSLLPAVINGPEDPGYVVVWMHGLGADGHDFEPIAEQLTFANKAQTRFIFPHAPPIAVTVNAGYKMPAWYDIFAFDAGAREDDPGIRQSERRIVAILENEIRHGVEPGKIVLAGFSQGGALALHTALRFPHRLAGVLALSTYLPVAGTLAAERSEQSDDANIMMMHGEYDQIVPKSMALDAKQRLFELGWSVKWRTYPMAHTVCLEQIGDISAWFDQVLV